MQVFIDTDELTGLGLALRADTLAVAEVALDLRAATALLPAVPAAAGALSLAELADAHLRLLGAALEADALALQADVAVAELETQVDALVRELTGAGWALAPVASWGVAPAVLPSLFAAPTGPGFVAGPAPTVALPAAGTAVGGLPPMISAILGPSPGPRADDVGAAFRYAEQIMADPFAYAPLQEIDAQHLSTLGRADGAFLESLSGGVVPSEFTATQPLPGGVPSMGVPGDPIGNFLAVGGLPPELQGANGLAFPADGVPQAGLPPAGTGGAAFGTSLEGGAGITSLLAGGGGIQDSLNALTADTHEFMRAAGFNENGMPVRADRLVHWGPFGLMGGTGNILNQWAPMVEATRNMWAINQFFGNGRGVF